MKQKQARFKERKPEVSQTVVEVSKIERRSMSENNGGDVLAKGGVRCQFRAAGSNVTQERWDAIWAEDENDTASGSRNPNSETARDASPDSREAQSDQPTV